MAQRLIYGWADKYHRKGDPEAVGRRIEAIAAQSDTAFAMAPPAAIVEDARREDSPLHPHFTWDAEIAAGLWNLEEARQLVRSLVRVEITAENEDEPKHFRAFVSIEDGEGNRGYVTTLKAASTPELRRQMVADALAGLRSWRSRYQELKELRPVMDAIEQLNEEMNAVAV